jgi:hypothetical protein
MLDLAAEKANNQKAEVSFFFEKNISIKMFFIVLFL